MPSYIRTSQSDFRFQEDNKDVILLVGANAKLADCYVNALENEFPNSDVIYCKDIQHIEQLRLSTIKSVNLVIVDHSLNDKNIFQVDSLKSLFSSKPVTLAYDNSEVCSNYVRKYGERFDSHLPMDVKLDVWLSIIRLILSGGNYICPELLKEKYQKLETPCKIDTEQTRNVAAHNIVDIANEEFNPRDDSCLCKLTERETDVIKLIAAGQQNKVIAAGLDLSEHTVKLHIHHIISKLNVTNRTEAAAMFLKAAR